MASLDLCERGGVVFAVRVGIEIVIWAAEEP